jgi:hypothetical protein
MANIIKIKDVELIFGLTEGAHECFLCKQVLDQANIKFRVLHYGDDKSQQRQLDNMSTWSFGADFKQYKFTEFPIVTWKEFYDDYERFLEVAQSAEELKASNLLKNASLIK